MRVPGDFHGAYVLRTLGSSEFNYESAKKHLMNLNFDALGSRTMYFNTVAEEEVNVEAGDHTNNHGRGRLMRLATWVNLDSHFSVSFYDSACCASSLAHAFRLDVLELCSAMSSEEGPQNTFPTIRTQDSHSEFVLPRCSH